MAEKRNRDRNNDNQRNRAKDSDRQNIGRRESSNMREDDDEIRQGSRRNTSQNTGSDRKLSEIDESEE